MSAPSSPLPTPSTPTAPASSATSSGTAAPGRVARRTPGLGGLTLPLGAARGGGALLLIVALAAGLQFGLSTLEPAARWALFVFGVAIVAWTVLDLDETPVALVAALALVGGGATSVERFYAGLGDDFIWLLVGAFVMAAVLQGSGLAQRWALQMVSAARTPSGLLRRLTVFIMATAFVVPSTSGRAALLLPVFLVLSQALPTPRLVRALALLFPSVILLSACMSMLGAGAHLVALDFMDRLGAAVPGFAGWIWLAGPFGLLSSVLACELILRCFLSPAERSLPLTLPEPERSAWTRSQRGVVGVTVATLLAWATGAWHGVPAPVVAIAGAVLATTRPLTGVELKDTLKRVEWNLVIFMAATLVMGEALLDSGAARGLADALMQALDLDAWSPLALLALASGLALLSHLVITSRTARATVLIPAVALPLAAGGIQPALLVFVMVIGSGFCQTLMVSAKPVAMFARREDQACFSPRDLAVLSLLLWPGLFALLWLWAAVVWPWQGLGAAA